MAKQPEDKSTVGLFENALSENIGHTMQFGKTGAGKTVFIAESMSRIRAFRARRKLFPRNGASGNTAVCELCGTRHQDPSKRTRWGGK